MNEASQADYEHLQILVRELTNKLEKQGKELLQYQEAWLDACGVARKYCPVELVGDSYINDGIPLLAKRAADAEKERDELRAQRIEPIRLASHDIEGWSTLSPDMNKDKEYLKELALKIDTEIVEELSIAAIIKANEELKQRVEVLEMAVEYLKKDL
jgi:hypothetical protein